MHNFYGIIQELITVYLSKKKRKKEKDSLYMCVIAYNELANLWLDLETGFIDVIVA